MNAFVRAAWWAAVITLASVSVPLAAQGDAARAAPARIVIGSKSFTESVILGELMAQMLEEHTDLAVERRFGLTGTMVCQAAVRAGEIDLYAEYTGTGWATVLRETGKITDPLPAFLRVQQRYRDEFDLEWLQPFGLDNTYALAMTEAKAAELGIVRISDLLAHDDRLRAGFGFEFGNRPDGLRGLVATYGLEFGSVRTVEHGLAYEAIQSGAIDVIDAYSTDGKLLRYGLRVLDDDRHFFPPYHAAPVVRGPVLRDHPEVGVVLRRLAFRIDDATAQALNVGVEVDGRDAAAVAREFLVAEGLLEAADEVDARPRPGFFELVFSVATLWLGLQHLGLTLIAVLLAAAVAIPTGIAIVGRRQFGRFALGFAGVMQTVPSLALLAFMIPVFGLSVEAAVTALLLYALLPILRNTYTGIVEVDPDLVDAARGMGLTPRQILLHVQLPLAARTIMAGIRTATVISIGVATLAAFIGAGGLGGPIVEGLYLDDHALILSGAVPAALLAVLADAGLGLVERRLQARTGGTGE